MPKFAMKRIWLCRCELFTKSTQTRVGQLHLRSQNVVAGVFGDRHPRRHYEVQEVVCTPVVPQGETLVKVSLVKVYSSLLTVRTLQAGHGSLL